jgi:hypothetical protein
MDFDYSARPYTQTGCGESFDEIETGEDAGSRADRHRRRAAQGKGCVMVFNVFRRSRSCCVF